MLPPFDEDQYHLSLSLSFLFSRVAQRDIVLRHGAAGKAGNCTVERLQRGAGGDQGRLIFVEYGRDSP